MSNSAKWSCASLLAISLVGATVVIAGDDHTDGAGIWKAVTPRDGTMHGEFANHDPIGVSVGVKIKADCSINWVDPDSGRLYCFSSATSLVVFLDAPHAYLSTAMRKWDDLNKTESR
jgi:hypothetical protein